MVSLYLGNARRFIDTDFFHNVLEKKVPSIWGWNEDIFFPESSISFSRIDKLEDPLAVSFIRNQGEYFQVIKSYNSITKWIDRF